MNCPKCKSPVNNNATTCEWCGNALVIEIVSETYANATVSNPNAQHLPADRNFWLTVLFSIVTFGIYPLYLVHAFAKETNIACRDDGSRTNGLAMVILLSLVTFGIYAIVWQCMIINRRNAYLVRNGKPEGLQVSFYLLTIFLLSWLTLGIMCFVVWSRDLRLQNEVNKTYNEFNRL
ncbi:MAG: DUF4234 domain-containing protein [Bacteroidetes bacterium]|nr:DUF4234 domain-containing protein [Bacteroidota bacterium]